MMATPLLLTHHTFLVQPWDKAGVGSVVVTQLDDESDVVLILKPEDVDRLVVALYRAATLFAPDEMPV